MKSRLFTQHQRFRRWAKSGVFERIFKLLASEHDNEYMIIDATIVRAQRRRTKNLNGGHLACPRCHEASRVCRKSLRPILQASRLKAFLRLKSHLRQHNRQRLEARIGPTPNLDLKSKRLSHYAIQHPQHNYNTCGATPWR
jgi:hypothetical protein